MPLSKVDIFDEMLKAFNEEYRRRIRSAYSSGALPEDVPEPLVARALIAITAKDFEPRSKEGKEVLNNLSKFV